MKVKLFIRMVALVLTVALTVGFIPSCDSDDDYDDYENNGNNNQEERIPYHENYVFNDMTPTASLGYKAYPYTNKNSSPIIMGGNKYHGGFTIDYMNTTAYDGGYATFDVSHLEGKTLSFLLGCTEIQSNKYDNYSIIVIYLDDTQAVDTVVFTRKTPQRITLDLTGASTIKFEIYEGSSYCHIGVAELTAWDGDPVETGPAIADDVTSLQLVKDILPFAYANSVSFRSNREITGEQVTDSYGGDELSVLKDIDDEDVYVGGKPYNEAALSQMSASLIGDQKEFFCFNAEEQFQYLSFKVGCKDEENMKTGSSWIAVYADDKLVCEEQVFSDRLPNSYTVRINGCNTIRFEIIYEEGGQHTVAVYDAFVGKTEADVSDKGTNSGVSNLGDACRLIYNIKPYAVASNIEDPLYEGVSKYHTFSMAGRKYNEGVALKANANWVSGNSGAHICFDLEGQFKYLTFVAGILDKTETVVNDKLNIYLDGELSRTIDLHALDLPNEYTVELKNCRELKIELVGFDAMIRPTYGVANMIVYRDEVAENTLFEEPTYDYPDKMTLLENITPYLYNYGFGEMGDKDYYYVYTGSKQHGFKIGEELKHEGFMLQTSVHADLVGDAGQSAILMSAMTSSMILGGFMLLAADTVYESSFAAFDLHGQFKKVTFTVACQDIQELFDQPQTETLKIGNNEKIFAEFEIGSRMEPQTFTVDVENTDQLMFWLQCGDGTSSRYAIYDVVVEK